MNIVEKLKRCYQLGELANLLGIRHDCSPTECGDIVFAVRNVDSFTHIFYLSDVKQPDLDDLEDFLKQKYSKKIKAEMVESLDTVEWTTLSSDDLEKVCAIVQNYKL